MCLNPVQIRRVNPLTHSSRIDVVPCGKCMECLRRKQSDYAFISSRQALESGNIVFMTLTYRPEALPFVGVFESVSLESGQVLDRSKIHKINPEYYEEVRSTYRSQFADVCGQSVEVPTYFLDTPSPLVEKKFVTLLSGEVASFDFIKESGEVYGNKHVQCGTRERALVTPSLCRDDVKTWLKSSREAYKRQFGHRLDFKYFEVGEYGTKRSRPHYHILFYGISLLDAQFLANRWREQFGRVDIEEVTPRNGDTLQVAHEKVSRYLAKYLCKGEFEQEFVSCGYVERPRRVSSRRLGTENLDSLRAYILGFDVLGEYDPNCPPPHVLTRSSMDLLLSRRYLYKYDRNGNVITQKIPKAIVDRVYSVLYGKSQMERKRMGFVRSSRQACVVVRSSHSRSLLQRKILAYQKEMLAARDLADVRAASREGSFGPSSLDFRLAYSALQSASKSSRNASASRYRRELHAFYQRDLY